jgi:hypothetical protein
MKKWGPIILMVVGLFLFTVLAAALSVYANRP